MPEFAVPAEVVVKILHLVPILTDEELDRIIFRASVELREREARYGRRAHEDAWYQEQAEMAEAQARAESGLDW